MRSDVNIPPKRTPQAFSILDKDGSGVVTTAEMAQTYDVSANPAVQSGKASFHRHWCIPAGFLLSGDAPASHCGLHEALRSKLGWSDLKRRVHRKLPVGQCFHRQPLGITWSLRLLEMFEAMSSESRGS